MGLLLGIGYVRDYSGLEALGIHRFSTTTDYQVNDYVLKNGIVYRFTTAHTAGAWDSSQVTQIGSLAELINN